MSRKLYLSLFLLINLTIYSEESADFIIAEKLFNIYEDDISLEEVNKVLEFYSYDRALHKKALLLDNKENSLLKSKVILEKSELSTLESKIHYISILYRLTLYNDLLEIALNIDLTTVNNSNVLFYIADSYIRTDQYDKARVILLTAIHLFPDDLRFIELQYILFKDSKDLYKIINNVNCIESLVRLYNRIESELERLQIEVLLERKFKALPVSELNNLYGNYEILQPIFNSYKRNSLTGEFKLDTDSDTFADTLIEIENGQLKYKGVDLNRDNLIDYEIFLKDGTPELLNINSNSLIYDNYPYIDYIILRDNEIVIYDLNKNLSKLKLKDIISNSIQIHDLELLNGVPTKSVTYLNKNKQPYMKIEYRNRESYIKFTELNRMGEYDKAVLYENGKILNGLRDLDSDGIFDLSEVYENNELIGSVYSSSGIKEEYTYIEVLKSTEENILMKSKFHWWNK